jgi:hypothetical protein
LRAGNFLSTGQRGIARYGFTLRGSIPAVIGRRRIETTLFVDDRPGGDYLNITNAEDDLWTELASCDGLIYLLDPELSRQTTSPGETISTTAPGNFEYVQHVTGYVKQAAARHGWLERGRLPHYFAVCVTKFDLEWVFEQLLRERLLLPEADKATSIFPAVPTVREERARRAFECFTDIETRRVLERSFQTSRTRYFVLSSIGFYGARSGKVDARDFVNITTSNTIRDEVTPIDVLEPFIWIQRQVG